MWLAQSASPVVILDCGTGFASALAELMTHRGIPAVLSVSVPEGALRVIDASSLREGGGLLERNLACFRNIREFAKNPGSENSFFIAVQDMGGRFGSLLSDHQGADLKTGLRALLKTLRIEKAEGLIRLIDLDRQMLSPLRQAEKVFSEILQGGKDPEVGLCHSGERLIPEILPAPLSESRIAPDLPEEHSVVLVSGGGRGVTAAACRELARVRPLKFILLGRTALEEEADCFHGVEDEASLRQALLTDTEKDGRKLSPVEASRMVRQVLAAREIRQQTSCLREMGSQVCYLDVDIRDKAALGKALQSTGKEWGPIRGLIHGAGLIRDKLIVDKTDEQFEEVFQTKVTGLQNLLDLLQDEPLSLICLFSSVVAEYGNRGQSDYAMANEMLNHLAVAESVTRGASCRVLSLLWGPWNGGMVSSALAEHFRSRGVSLLEEDEGCRLFLEELSSGDRREMCPLLGKHPQAFSGEHVDAAALFSGKKVWAEIYVDQSSHPYLSSHVIQGRVTIPVVMVCEWLSRLCHQYFPDFPAREFLDLKVFRGLVADGFTGRGNCFRLEAVCQKADRDGAELLCTVCNEAGLVFYSARALIRKTAKQLPEELRWQIPQLSVVPDGPAPEYGGALFHGPDFQVIESLSALDRAGAVAMIKGVRGMLWQDEDWETDPAVCDGGLQLAVLWSEKVLGGASLPTGISRFRNLSSSPGDESVRCVLRGRDLRGQCAVSDMYFLDQDDHLLFVMEGVETHLRPDMKKTLVPSAEDRAHAADCGI